MLEMAPDDGLIAQIAENLLIELVKYDPSSGFCYLGVLHLSPKGSFISNDELAILYLDTAARQFRNLEAMNILGKCYLNGICVQKDTEKGMELIIAAGQEAENRLQSSELNEGNQIPPQPESIQPKTNEIPESESTSLWDVAISVGIVAAVVAGGWYFFKRNKK